VRYEIKQEYDCFVAKAGIDDLQNNLTGKIDFLNNNKQGENKSNVPGINRSKDQKQIQESVFSFVPFCKCTNDKFMCLFPAN
jgi:hypothetical protein